MAENKGDAPEYINLKVLGRKNSIILFKIKKHTPLKKLMKAYCERKGLAMVTATFHFEGQRIKGDDTPSSFKMKDGDIIELFLEQIGG